MTISSRLTLFVVNSVWRTKEKFKGRHVMKWKRKFYVNLDCEPGRKSLKQGRSEGRRPLSSSKITLKGTVASSCRLHCIFPKHLCSVRWDHNPVRKSLYTDPEETRSGHPFVSGVVPGTEEGSRIDGSRTTRRRRRRHDCGQMFRDSPQGREALQCSVLR